MILLMLLRAFIDGDDRKKNSVRQEKTYNKFYKNINKRLLSYGGALNIKKAVGFETLSRKNQ